MSKRDMWDSVVRHGRPRSVLDWTRVVGGMVFSMVRGGVVTCMVSPMVVIGPVGHHCGDQ